MLLKLRVNCVMLMKSRVDSDVLLKVRLNSNVDETKCELFADETDLCTCS